MRTRWLLLAGAALAACGGDDDAPTPDAAVAVCETPPPAFEVGDATGHAAPLGAGAGEARAGRLTAGQIPTTPSGLLTWQAGDFVLANDHVALVIEDVGDSELIDPWGGRPIGVARVEGGALVEPADFGELLIFAGRSSPVTTTVSVIADGSDGGPAVVRASGRLAGLPFLAPPMSALYPDQMTDVTVAIDYVLEPDADAVTVRLHYASPRPGITQAGSNVHGFLYGRRTPMALPGEGFTEQVEGDWVQFVDDDATSWAYGTAVPMDSTISTSGIILTFTEALTIPACGTATRDHARLVIGGPGLDGLEQARARVVGVAQRAITGTVTAGGAPLAGARVHVTAGEDYLTRAPTDEAGAFTVHVPASAAVTLTAYKRGWLTATADVGAEGTTAALEIAASGAVHVTATEAGAGAIPVRVQLLPAGASTIPTVPERFGEPGTVAGRLDVEYPIDGDVTIPAPAGTWQVVVSRGFEYEIVDTEVTVVAGETVEVDAVLDRVIDTTDVMCGDFHIHTHRSFDSGDDAREKVRSAVADGVELPVRSEHDVVDSFAAIIAELGVGAWAKGIGSIEITAAQLYGHFGVFPLEPDPEARNGGAIPWQRWPTAEDPDAEVENLGPVEVVNAARARPEAPAVIVNHPRQIPSDYFNYVGLDPATGMVDRPAAWDDDLRLIEVFNDADSPAVRLENLADWYGLLNADYTVFAVGSSDSHRIRLEPLGYPRTCVEVGTDEPATVTANAVRDGLSAGHATISGGIYVDAAVGAAGPGDTATGLGATATVTVRVQAASWVDVDGFDVIVDGEVVTAEVIEPGDADPGNPAVRWSGTVDVPVAADGSWVVLHVRGDAPLEPVHIDRLPFAVSNPIFLRR
jgi:hypothetical protein